MNDDALQNGSRAPREEDVEARARLAQNACASFLANERKLDMFAWPAHVCTQRVSARVQRYRVAERSAASFSVCILSRGQSWAIIIHGVRAGSLEATCLCRLGAHFLS
jgi:hypothetical protein